MAVKSVTELLSQIQQRFGDDTTDETLAFIEDVSDTVNDLQSRANGETNWEQKYHENDAAWRQRYRDRFFNKNDDQSVTEIDEDDGEDTYKPKTFNDLFKED